MHDVLRAWLHANVERTVEFSSLELSWTEGLLVRDLVVAEEVEGDPPLLEAPLVVLRMPLFPAIFRDFRVESLEVRGAVVRIVRRADGDTNADALRTRKVRRKTTGPDVTGDAQEATAFPDIRIPVEVRDLTLVFRNADGREARKAGISFTGTLSTRDAPTTFALDVSDAGRASALRVEGTARLFDADGVLLPPDRIEAKTSVVAQSLDAAANRDVLSLFTDAAPHAGLLDARAEIDTVGATGRASFDLRLRGLAAGPADAASQARPGDDLTASGNVVFGGGSLSVEGFRVRANGLSVEADVAGPTDALRGRATLDADLGSMTAALRAIGWEFPADVSGKAGGSVDFEPAEAGSASSARGRLVIEGVRVSGIAAGRPPVTFDRMEANFTASTSQGSVRIDSSLSLPDMKASAAGTVGKGGRCDMTGTVTGDLGGLLARVRDLGALPAAFSINGTLDAAVSVHGLPSGVADDALVVELSRLRLTDEDVAIEAQGRWTRDEIQGAVRGEGDLGRLLRRARGGGESEPEPLAGRFSFEAQTSGPPGAPTVTLPRFRLTGDLDVDATGGVTSEGAVTAKVHAEGRLADAISVLRRVGVVPEGVSLDGSLRADAVVGGTRARPEVPSFAVSISGDHVALDAVGALAADRTISSTAKGSFDLGKVAEVLRTSGLVAGVPPLAGRVEFDVQAAGATDNVALPRFAVRVRDAVIEADVTGAVATSGRVSGRVTASGELEDVARLARQAGWLDRDVSPRGRVTLEAVVGGTRNHVQVPESVLRIDGPVAVTLRGVYDAAQNLRANVDVRGPLQPVLDLAAQWRGTERRILDGTIEGTASVDGPRHRLVFAAPRISVRAAGLVLDAGGARDADGNVEARLTARGGLTQLADVLRSLGFAPAALERPDFATTGSFDVTVEGGLQGRVAEGGLSAVATDVRCGDPRRPAEMLREPRVVLTVPRSRFHLDERRLDPVTCSVDAEDARVEAIVELVPPARADAEAAPGGDAAATRVLRANGRMEFGSAFSARHRNSLGGVAWERIEGPFRFEGDVSAGRAGSASWQGGFELDAKTLTAPHVNVETARAVARLEGGTLVVEPIEGRVNGGTFSGRARIGLAGETPAHSLELTATDVRIDADLAPLVARVSPLFALGEEGNAGGLSSMDLRLTASGLDGASVRRTLAGGGELGLSDAYVESSRLVGDVLKLLGKSGRLDLRPARIPFTVEDGRVRTGDLGMEGAGLALRLAGDVDLDGKLAYGLRVRPLRAGSSFDKYARLLDPEGYLPLRIEGRLTDPKLRAPDWKDLLTGEAANLIGGLLGKDRKDDEEPPPPPLPPRKRR